MFGFLKQKIADFGKKVKATATKKEEELQQPKEEIIKKETREAKPKEEKKTEVAKEAPKKEENKETLDKQNQKKQETVKKEQPIAEEEKKKEDKITEKKDTQKNKEDADSKTKKTGLFGKLFGLGKKKEEKQETTEGKSAKETKQPEKKKEDKGKKKTNEEIAAEMEAKMFKEIEGELKGEEDEVSQEVLEEEIHQTEEQKEKPQEEEIKETQKEEKKTEDAKEKIIEKEEIKLQKTEEEKEIEEDVEEELEKEEETEEQEEITEEISREKTRDIHIKTLEEDKRELKAHVGAGGKIKGFLFGGVEIAEKDINDLLWELELSLIESDVEADAANEIVKQIKSRLVGKKVSAKGLDEYLKEQIKEILTEMMHTKTINLLDEAAKKKNEGKPLVILMIGPNGAGKTTSIAKLAHYFKKNNLTSVIAAGDTFRAGAIDQIEEHAKRLGVRVIKQQYGADPAAVSFDAIKAAEAGKIDVVLIDSAGRQETNKNLMEELRKIERVAKPDLRLYVGEAYVGQTLLEQVAEFEEMIGIDGFILTKIDTDAKGGTAISLLYKMKKPIVFVGTGQGYDDFKEFTPEFVLERII
ncbi:MAG: signal recognition particle-docking protein FtsY [archaeon]